MLTLYSTILSAFMACLRVSFAAGPANYSVQLMADLAPSAWSAEQWAAVADNMIGKIQAHILSDLIEDLGIKLKVTEESIREQINKDRAMLDLKPLPPHADKPGRFANLFNKDRLMDDDENYSTYLPPRWTEEKLKDYTTDEFLELPEDVRPKLQERLTRDLEVEILNPNKGFFSELPSKVLNNITSKLHESARVSMGLSHGVRAYKRELAPLVQVAMLQDYNLIGLLIIRISYSNDTAWKAFLNGLNDVAEAQLDNDYYGTGMDTVVGKVALPIEESRAMDGATIEQCRLRYTLMKAADEIELGFDVGVVLVADEGAINALADLTSEVPAYFLAVDTTYDPKKAYPEGYEGVFEVRPHSLWHHLYVALGSGMMTPVQVWELTQQKDNPTEVGKKSHDEL